MTASKFKLRRLCHKPVRIAGGRPSSSYYLVSAQGDGIFNLDPHHSGPAVLLRLFVPSLHHSTSRKVSNHPEGFCSHQVQASVWEGLIRPALRPSLRSCKSAETLVPAFRAHRNRWRNTFRGDSPSRLALTDHPKVSPTISGTSTLSTHSFNGLWGALNAPPQVFAKNACLDAPCQLIANNTFPEAERVHLARLLSSGLHDVALPTIRVCLELVNLTLPIPRLIQRIHLSDAALGDTPLCTHFSNFLCEDLKVKPEEVVLRVVGVVAYDELKSLYIGGPHAWKSIGQPTSGDMLLAMISVLVRLPTRLGQDPASRRRAHRRRGGHSPRCLDLTSCLRCRCAARTGLGLKACCAVWYRLRTRRMRFPPGYAAAAARGRSRGFVIATVRARGKGENEGEGGGGRPDGDSYMEDDATPGSASVPRSVFRTTHIRVGVDEYLIRTTREPSDDLSVSALLAYVNARHGQAHARIGGAGSIAHFYSCSESRLDFD
ncbi:hypothetical protein GGX14DRAFT_568835 [Mycena pura]|uniref:Cysteine protease n=1 Tax=Mycena pura TaxID=153505 RepID=A0AAD6Y8K8_9AGAR|nr:hypothetical protein GGX14DRAFT_568835 [Mycena pura]